MGGSGRGKGGDSRPLLWETKNSSCATFVQGERLGVKQIATTMLDWEGNGQ